MQDSLTRSRARQEVNATRGQLTFQFGETQGNLLEWVGCSHPRSFAMDIMFGEGRPKFLFVRDALEFPAVADGSPVRCIVSAELLMERCGAQDNSQIQMEKAYDKNRAAIQWAARELIEAGHAKDGEVLLTTKTARLE